MSTMIPKEKLCEMYTKMLQIRKFDEKIAYFFTLGKVHGTTHLYIGEEATAVGVCSALKDTDYMTSTHRGHGHCIAKGIDLNRMMAEMLGKYNGYCRGKGGSNDADAEYMALIRDIMDEAGVDFQTCELGRVNAGGGGTIAYIMAKYGMNVIDSGVAVLSMHALWEVANKADIYEAYRGYKAFIERA